MSYTYTDAPKRSSGLDFSDGKVPALEQHPDLGNRTLVGSYLQRNKTERRRLQGLQRSTTSVHDQVTPFKPQNWQQKWQLWMINEGGRRMFFFVWIFLHLLVLALGTLHYGLKDNLVGARATFGVTFSTYPVHIQVTIAWLILTLQPSHVRLLLSSTSM
jgi:NADPH oxidase 2